MISFLRRESAICLSPNLQGDPEQPDHCHDRQLQMGKLRQWSQQEQWVTKIQEKPDLSR